MDEKDLLQQEKELADKLRRELAKVSEPPVKAKVDLSEIEIISEKPYVSPIMTMDEDDILAFVEEFDVSELATLSVAELNRIGEVLGVDPSILADVDDTDF